MSKKNLVLETERLYIIPMTEEELRLQIEAEQDSEQKKAYEEMLNGYLSEPLDYLWYLPWKLVLKDSSKAIGDIGFKGPQIRGSVEIGYGMLPSHRRQGYMKEAAEAMVRWAFKQSGVYTVVAETTPDNKPSRSLLESIGFVMFANGQEGPRYRRNKPIVYTGFVILIVMALLGLAAGIAFDEVGILLGSLIGVGLGLIGGFIKDYHTRTVKKRVTGEK